MLDINRNLKLKLSELNDLLNEKYRDIQDVNSDNMRHFISNHIGYIETLEKLDNRNLTEIYESGGVLAVDGSKNRIGGAYPHFVELYQGLAKNSTKKESNLFEVDFYTPLYGEREREILKKIKKENPSREEMDTFVKNYKLASIEVEAAIKGIEKFNPCVVMMDGSLIRYKIECSDNWQRLKRICEDKNIYLLGVTKDIKTNIIGNKLGELEMVSPPLHCLYDRELMYGILEYGEILLIKDENISKEGLSSCFMRTSKAPSVIGVDILTSQKRLIRKLANLVYTLTPKNSRGVPLWIDIVDKEVRITDKMMEMLMDKYIDKELLEKLLIPERKKRTL